MQTFELIEKYAITKLVGYRELRVDNYSINGSMITIVYSYEYDWGTIDRSYDNTIEVELLDYITFVFNCK